MSAQPNKDHGITEGMIHDLVHTFYDKIRDHQELGPIFNRVIGNGWDAHLAKMCDFWSSVVLKTGRFKGAPMPAHLRLKMVQPSHFAQWLDLFQATALSLFSPEIAAIFVSRAENIARSLQLGMFFQPGSPGASPRHAAQSDPATSKWSLS
jgi:hemoglobin